MHSLPRQKARRKESHPSLKILFRVYTEVYAAQLWKQPWMSMRLLNRSCSCSVSSQLEIPVNSAAGINLAATLQGPKELGSRIFSRCCAPSEELAEKNQHHKVSNIYCFISGYFTHHITRIYIYPEYFINSSIQKSK